MLLTVEMLTEAISQVPAHRAEIKRGLRNTLQLVRRGIAITDAAPIWVQAQNIIFVSKIDVDIKESDGTEF